MGVGDGGDVHGTVESESGEHTRQMAAMAYILCDSIGCDTDAGIS